VDDEIWLAKVGKLLLGGLDEHVNEKNTYDTP
jgi:hypothetical protein